MSSVVPIGTRFLTVQLVATRATGLYNDGYADELSVVLPEPSASLLGAGAFAVLALLRVRPPRNPMPARASVRTQPARRHSAVSRSRVSWVAISARRVPSTLQLVVVCTRGRSGQASGCRA